MRILADENIERWLITNLEAQGHEILRIPQHYRTSDPDDAVLQSASSAGVVLLTRDKDFGALVFHESIKHRGVILLRLRRLSRALQIELLERALALLEAQPGQYVVVTPGGARFGQT